VLFVCFRVALRICSPSVRRIVSVSGLFDILLFEGECKIS